MAAQASPFPWRRICDIDSAIKELKRRSVQSFRHGLKRSDLMMMFAKPKDRPILERASRIVTAGPFAQVGSFSTKFGEYNNIEAYIEVGVHGTSDDIFLMPKYAKKEGFQPDLPDDVKQRVDAVLIRLIKNDLDWRYVKAVTDALINRCQTASQVKMVMPTIVTLFRTPFENGYEGDDDYADRIYSQALPREMPALPPLLRQCAVDVGMTVTRGSMLPVKPEAKQIADDFVFRVTVKDEITVPWGDAKLPEVV